MCQLLQVLLLGQVVVFFFNFLNFGLTRSFNLFIEQEGSSLNFWTLLI